MLQRTPSTHTPFLAMGIFKGFTLFKKSAKKEAKTDAAEPVLEPVVAEAEVKAAAEPVVEAPTVDASSKDGDAPALKAEQGTEEPAAENAEVVEFVMPAAVAVEEELPAKTGWFSCTMCK